DLGRDQRLEAGAIEAQAPALPAAERLGDRARAARESLVDGGGDAHHERAQRGAPRVAPIVERAAIAHRAVREDRERALVGPRSAARAEATPARQARRRARERAAALHVAQPIEHSHQRAHCPEPIAAPRPAPPGPRTRTRTLTLT